MNDSSTSRPSTRWIDEEYRKLAFMFPEYLFLDKEYSICLAGRNIEELLKYGYGMLRDKNINFIAGSDDLKSSIMIQIAENFFEWRSYCLKDSNTASVPVEISGFRMAGGRMSISPIAIRVRRSRNYLEENSNPEVERLTYWIAHNLRGPLATIEGLINLARNKNANSDVITYLNYMSQQTKYLEEKIRLMTRLAGKVVK
jgi:nitrogen-specific signal transduction histidine kinase